ncbi:hypothetical protein [Streptomyces sp. NPDC046887]|uniref:hypothetical protein n=1 Tax=Streptomyces sp. NPDC046887 TaxID=3155472 RepID=UPI0033D065FA
MAWDEWEQLKAAAAERSSTHMQLNQLPPEDLPNAGAPVGDLAVSQKDLAAIGNEAFGLYNRLWKEARVADTDDCGSALSGEGLALGGALRHVATRWDRQLGTLMDACALISNHMDFTKNAHQGDEYHIERHVSSIQTLDAGFAESWAARGDKSPVHGEQEKKKD